MKNIKTILKKVFPPNSDGHWILSGFYNHPIRFIPSLIKSFIATHKLTNKLIPIRVRLDIGKNVKIHRSSSAQIIIDDHLLIGQWGGINSDSSISCGDRAVLKIKGDFEIGPGVHLSIANDATLILGGRNHSTGSGITCNTRVMVRNFIEIGADTIIAWDVFISDSDWHTVKGVVNYEPIKIGDRVWIAHGASILKGAIIPSGCIVGAKSLVSKGEFPANTLLAGIPATVRRTEIEWSR